VNVKLTKILNQKTLNTNSSIALCALSPHSNKTSQNTSKTLPSHHSKPSHLISSYNKYVLDAMSLINLYYRVFLPPPMLSHTLSWWWGLSAPETLRAMPAVAHLLVGSPRPDRSRGRSQTKRDTLVLQVGGWT
jgi:hypothetical protein